MKIKKAVIPAAGLGTRVLPATKAMPKEMLPIVDKPAIQYIVEEAVAAGIEDILIITADSYSAKVNKTNPKSLANIWANNLRRTLPESTPQKQL